MVDLFALGVILYNLYTSSKPFDSATIQDIGYRRLQAVNNDDFWNSKSKGREPDFFTEDFKDLITSMLQAEPHKRLTLADIIGHPWMQGEHAS